MTRSAPGPRLLGVSIPDVSDWQQPLPPGKWSQFFAAIARRIELVGVIRPTLTRRQSYANLVQSVRPSRASWAAKAGFGTRHVTQINAALQAAITPRLGTFDAIVQLQTLCSPRSPGVEVPYVIYTDSTMALTQRIRPLNAPLRPADVVRFQAFEAQVCHAAELVFTFSDFARESVVRDYGVPADRVLAIGAGANQLLAHPASPPPGPPSALFVGSPFRAKGGEVLLHAWPQIRRAVPGAQLVIVGPRRAPGGIALPGVTFRGRVDRVTLAGLYRAASVFVLPSLFDAWGHVFVEAMGHGLPCVGSNCCAMPEIIRAGETGLLVEPESIEPLADALIELLSDPARAEAMGRAGYRRVLAELTWDHVAERFVSGLESRVHRAA